MILHNAGDWLRKFVRLRLARSGAAPATSNGPASRCACLRSNGCSSPLLVVSFFILVWTGFALKYPDHWWAKPLLQWETAKSMRGFIHRVDGGDVRRSLGDAPGVVVREFQTAPALARDVAPGLSDVTEAGGNFAYNLGLRFRKPGRSSHSYIEKAEYWAVVWGAVVMIATGLMLWANTFAPEVAAKGMAGRRNLRPLL